MKSFKSIARRALLALFATLLGIGIGTAVNLALVMLIDHKPFPGLKALATGYAGFLAFTAIIGVWGWVAGFVVLVTFAESRSWRLWAWVIIGTLIGVVSVYFQVGRPFGPARAGSGDAWFYAWAAVDAGLTTLTYLLLLRWQYRKTVHSKTSLRSASQT